MLALEIPTFLWAWLVSILVTSAISLVTAVLFVVHNHGNLGSVSQLLAKDFSRPKMLQLLFSLNSSLLCILKLESSLQGILAF